ncbi:hypothetical protein Ae706Ps2_4538c [Pseudonocardia sp. Ae706_Ps2]|nr:hypothetical protein Ae505Ps2_0754 [Pseudonocardia sp. Ae505_Ps2]OLM26105.1 hypothetical protein Ae706Ps2_4538c [Pseudonocardia sp. Ae706_Ps2]
MVSRIVPASPSPRAVAHPYRIIVPVTHHPKRP